MPDALSRHQVLAPLLLGVVGFLANLLRVEIFFNVDFIFGSAFVMFAILHAGLGLGVVAALVAGSATWVLWNHPWALVILAAEAFFVGWLTHRRSWDLLLADILFWTVLGAPLVWVFYHHLLHTQIQTTALIILKQGVNGIINTMLAYLIHLAWRALTRPGTGIRPALRPAFFITMVAMVAFPALLFLVAYVRQGIQQEEQLLIRHSAELDGVARQALRAWIEDKHQGVITLASLATRPDLPHARLQEATEIIRMATPAFRRVGVLDAKADVIAYSPLTDDEGRSVIGRNFADRPYLPALRASLRPQVGDLVMGRIGRPQPMLPLLAPLLREGRYNGYCIGVTNIDNVRDLLQTLAGPGGAQLTLLDRNQRVISSTRPELAVMSEFHLPLAEIRPLGEGAWQSIPVLKPGASRMQRWRNSVLVRESMLTPSFTWRVRVELPLEPMLDSLTRVSLFGLGTLYLLILATAALAQALSQGFTDSIRRLEAATRAFPQLLKADSGQLSLPPSGIEEMHRLNGHFQQMVDALRSSFRELNALKDTLEQRVASRTRELQEAVDTIKTLHGIIPICASCKKIRDDQGSWNQLETYISQHTDADFTHGICPDCSKRLYPGLHTNGPEDDAGPA